MPDSKVRHHDKRGARGAVDDEAARRQRQGWIMLVVVFVALAVLIALASTA